MRGCCCVSLAAAAAAPHAASGFDGGCGILRRSSTDSSGFPAATAERCAPGSLQAGLALLASADAFPGSDCCPEAPLGRGRAAAAAARRGPGNGAAELNEKIVRSRSSQAADFSPGCCASGAHSGLDAHHSHHVIPWQTHWLNN